MIYDPKYDKFVSANERKHEITLLFNPTNIRHDNGIEWAGAVGGTKNGEYEKFQSVFMGFRAAFSDIRNKMEQFDGDIGEMLRKFAPEFENPDIENYIEYVKKEALDGRDKVTEADLINVITAMTKFENPVISSQDKEGKYNAQYVTEFIEGKGLVDTKLLITDYYLRDPQVLKDAHLLSLRNFESRKGGQSREDYEAEMMEYLPALRDLQEKDPESFQWFINHRKEKNVSPLHKGKIDAQQIAQQRSLTPSFMRGGQFDDPKYYSK